MTDPTPPRSGPDGSAGGASPPELNTLTLRPIGVVRSPFADRHSAPRQPALAQDTAAQIELLPQAELEHGLSDIEEWSHLWVLYWFHLNAHFRPKVEAPRSERRRGVFATRSPYRPNPIGLSAVKLERVEGRVLHVRGMDMIDGTPVLDLKPYVPYTDHVAANSGWLETIGSPKDPGPQFEVDFGADARTQLEWLKAQASLELEPAIVRILSTGPVPHPYRRIKRDGSGYRLGLRDWRVRFSLDGKRVHVSSIASGYKSSVLADPKAEAKTETALEVHRAFIAAFERR
jgi:tRNA-Thr(GGU) m(6)t(6)A37 methyltransferase TsaA